MAVQVAPALLPAEVEQPFGRSDRPLPLLGPARRWPPAQVLPSVQVPRPARWLVPVEQPLLALPLMALPLAAGPEQARSAFVRQARTWTRPARAIPEKLKEEREKASSQSLKNFMSILN